MARKPTDIKPLFDIKADYEASLARFIHEASMLCDAVTSLISMGAVSDTVATVLRERVAAFDAARFSDE